MLLLVVLGLATASALDANLPQRELQFLGNNCTWRGPLVPPPWVVDELAAARASPSVASSVLTLGQKQHLSLNASADLLCPNPPNCSDVDPNFLRESFLRHQKRPLEGLTNWSGHLRWTPTAEQIVQDALARVQFPGDCNKRKFLRAPGSFADDVPWRERSGLLFAKGPKQQGLTSRVHSYLPVFLVALNLDRTVTSPPPGSLDDISKGGSLWEPITTCLAKQPYEGAALESNRSNQTSSESVFLPPGINGLASWCRCKTIRSHRLLLSCRPSEGFKNAGPSHRSLDDAKVVQYQPPGILFAKQMKLSEYTPSLPTAIWNRLFQEKVFYFLDDDGRHVSVDSLSEIPMAHQWFFIYSQLARFALKPNQDILDMSVLVQNIGRKTMEDKVQTFRIMESNPQILKKRHVGAVRKRFKGQGLVRKRMQARFRDSIPSMTEAVRGEGRRLLSDDVDLVDMVSILVRRKARGHCGKEDPLRYLAGRYMTVEEHLDSPKQYITEQASLGSVPDVLIMGDSDLLTFEALSNLYKHFEDGDESTANLRIIADSYCPILEIVKGKCGEIVHYSNKWDKGKATVDKVRTSECIRLIMWRVGQESIAFG
eukprot:scaffold7398_cov362-Prasinococcus_capsulatus_cf.AAC.2